MKSRSNIISCMAFFIATLSQVCSTMQPTLVSYEDDFSQLLSQCRCSPSKDSPALRPKAPHSNLIAGLYHAVDTNNHAIMIQTLRHDLHCPLDKQQPPGLEQVEHAQLVLCHALCTGQARMALTLLRHGCPINPQHRDKQTRDALPEQIQTNQNSALCAAVYSRCRACLELLLRIRPDLVGKDGTMALRMACHHYRSHNHGNHALLKPTCIVNKLIDKGVDPRITDPQTEATSLLLAVERADGDEDQAKLIKILLDVGVDPNKPRRCDNTTALMAAMTLPHFRPEIARMFLEQPYLDLNIRDDLGRTAVHLALETVEGLAHQSLGVTFNAAQQIYHQLQTRRQLTIVPTPMQANATSAQTTSASHEPDISMYRVASPTNQ